MRLLSREELNEKISALDSQRGVLLFGISFQLVDGLAALDGFGGYYHRFNIGARWDLVHDIGHKAFSDGAKSASARVALECQLCDLLEGALGKLKLNAVHCEELLILLDK